jgi:hypothetical protein
MNRLLSSSVAVAAFSWLAFFVSTTAQASITINETSLDAQATEPNGQVEQYFYGTSIPTSTTVSAVVGSAHNNTTINWSFSGGQTILSFDMDHKRPAGGSAAQTYMGIGAAVMSFTANADAAYTVSGFYNATDVGKIGFVYEGIWLHDITANIPLFDNSQESRNTANEQFVVGETGGDTSNSLSGSSTGILIAGHEYSLNFEYFIFPHLFGDSGASALGNATLTINDIAAPEPSTLSLLGIGAISLLGYRKHTRQKL